MPMYQNKRKVLPRWVYISRSSLACFWTANLQIVPPRIPLFLIPESEPGLALLSSHYFISQNRPNFAKSKKKNSKSQWCNTSVLGSQEGFALIRHSGTQGDSFTLTCASVTTENVWLLKPFPCKEHKPIFHWLRSTTQPHMEGYIEAQHRESLKERQKHGSTMCSEGGWWAENI